MIVVNAQAALAHPEFNPVATNRYLKLTLLSPTEVRLAYTVMYGAQPAQAARKAADANADGVLDEAETRTVGQRLLGEVRKGLQLTVDGKPAELVFEAPQVGFATGGNAVAPDPFSIDLVARVACPGAPPHELHLDDATELPALGETETRVEESPQTSLVASYRGRPDENDHEKETRIIFRGPKRTMLEDRSVTVRFTANGAAAQLSTAAAQTPEGQRRWPWLGIPFVAVLCALGAGRLARRYRSMKG